MTNISQVDKFVKVLTELFDNSRLIIEDLHQHGVTNLTPLNVDLIKNVVLNKDKFYLIKTFIETSYPYWDNIKSKNDDFFINNSDKIFGEYAKYDELNSIKVIFGKNAQGNPAVDNETKDSLRPFFNSLIKISIRYIFECKEPNIERIEEDGKKKVKISYKSNAYPHIRVLDVAKLWGVELIP
jgi:hypothetical protein